LPLTFSRYLRQIQFGDRFRGGGGAYPDTRSYDGSDHRVCARLRRSRVDFPPTPPGGATATGPRWGLLAHVACRNVQPRAGSPAGKGGWSLGSICRLAGDRASSPLQAPEWYPNLLNGLSCRIARERAAHASSSVDDAPAVGALGAFGLRRQASRRPPGREGRSRASRPCRASGAGGTRRDGHSLRRW